MRYTITDWRNVQLDSAEDFTAAVRIARWHATQTQAAAKIHDTVDLEVRDVAPDGTLGKTWHSYAPYSDSRAEADALDEIEDRR